MDNYLETTDRRSKRHGFFDRPASVDFGMNVLSSWRLKKASVGNRWPWRATALGTGKQNLDVGTH